MLVSAKIYNPNQFAEYGKKMEQLIKIYSGEYLAKGSISDILEGYFDKFIKKNPDQQIKIEIFRKK